MPKPKTSKKSMVSTFGLVEVHVPCLVISGRGKRVVSVDKFGPGDVFNSLAAIGFWHEVCPTRRASKKPYFRPVGPLLEAETVNKLNSRNRGL